MQRPSYATQNGIVILKIQLKISEIPNKALFIKQSKSL